MTEMSREVGRDEETKRTREVVIKKQGTRETRPNKQQTSQSAGGGERIRNVRDERRQREGGGRGGIVCRPSLAREEDKTATRRRQT
jgi:hypothetical protein